MVGIMHFKTVAARIDEDIAVEGLRDSAASMQNVPGHIVLGQRVGQLLETKVDNVDHNWLF